jgi:hypothetical protein
MSLAIFFSGRTFWCVSLKKYVYKTVERHLKVSCPNEDAIISDHLTHSADKNNTEALPF